MRDLVAREALRDLATEAGARFRELVRSGREIPYEVREPTEGSPFCQYLPMTRRFIRDHSGQVASLRAYGPAKSAISSAKLAGPYLDAIGLDSSVDPGRQVEDAVIVFLCRLWQGSTDFTIDPNRLEAALAELECSGQIQGNQIEVVVPIVGLQMSVSRLELAEVSLVRTDIVEAPPEAIEASGAGRAEWESQFLACSTCPQSDVEIREDSDAIARAPIAARFHRTITALRLYKSGSVALGPHGWTRTGTGRWRRIATAAGRTRGGSYHLTDTELGELASFTRSVERRRTQIPALGRAISRLEAGLERPSPLEALNDHLLALRFLLEGDGPSNTGMPMRVAALCAPPQERDQIRNTVERALALEKQLWSGEPAPADDGRSPVEVAGEVEELLRAILRDAVCGHLGDDLRAAADEILLADGLRVGEGDAAQRGETSEWEPARPVAESLDEMPIGEVEEIVAEESKIRRVLPAEQPSLMDEPLDMDRFAEPVQSSTPQQQPPFDESPQLVSDGWTPFVPTIEEEDEVFEEELTTLRALPDPPPDPEPLFAEDPEEPSDGEATMQESAAARQTREPMAHRNEARSDDWLAEAGDPGATLNFPERGPAMRLLDHLPEEREAMRQRVSTLFPVPDTIDWSVGELDTERQRQEKLGA